MAGARPRTSGRGTPLTPRALRALEVPHLNTLNTSYIQRNPRSTAICRLSPQPQAYGVAYAQAWDRPAVQSRLARQSNAQASSPFLLCAAQHVSSHAPRLDTHRQSGHQSHRGPTSHRSSDASSRTLTSSRSSTSRPPTTRAASVRVSPPLHILINDGTPYKYMIINAHSEYYIYVCTFLPRSTQTQCVSSTSRPAPRIIRLRIYLYFAACAVRGGGDMGGGGAEGPAAARRPPRAASGLCTAARPAMRQPHQGAR